MGIVKEIEGGQYEAGRREFTDSLVKMEDQLRLIEQKLTVYTDKEIHKLYHKRCAELNQLEAKLGYDHIELRQMQS